MCEYVTVNYFHKMCVCNKEFFVLYKFSCRTCTVYGKASLYASINFEFYQPNIASMCTKSWKFLLNTRYNRLDSITKLMAINSSTFHVIESAVYLSRQFNGIKKMNLTFSIDYYSQIVIFYQCDDCKIKSEM